MPVNKKADTTHNEAPESAQVKKAKTEHVGAGNSQETIEKRGWKVRTFDGLKELFFQPIFRIKDAKKDAENALVQATDKDVECRFVDLEIPDDKGNKVNFRLNFLDLFMFIYTICNEELRQQLNLRYERQYTRIPYQVSFKLTPEEMGSGTAQRLIELEVDEIAMAMARSQANMLAGKDPGRYADWFAKRKGKNKGDQIIIT